MGLRVCIEYKDKELKEGIPAHHLYISNVFLIKTGVGNAPVRVTLQTNDRPNPWHTIADYPLQDPCDTLCGTDRMPEECGKRTGTYPCKDVDNAE